MKITSLFLLVLDEALEGTHYNGPFRQNDWQALTNGVYGRKILELTAEQVVITLFGLFEGGEMLFQFAGLGESYSVNTLQHFIVANLPASKRPYTG